MLIFEDIYKQWITSETGEFGAFSLIPRDLAGGLAIQEAGMVFVKGISGCFFNVMGFPMSKFYQELREFQQ